MENKPQNVFEKLDKQGEQIDDISSKLEGISINDLYALAKRTWDYGDFQTAQKYYNQFRKPEGDDISMASVPKLHAEINCLNQLKHLNINFSKVKLYIYRIRNDRPYGYRVLVRHA